MKKTEEQKTTKPCEKCGKNLWKTKVKNQSYECRNCGEIRNSEQE